MSKALLLIDIQNDYFEGGLYELADSLQAVKNAQNALNTFRESNLLIIHVKHINISEDATFFLPNSKGAMIHHKVEPLNNEHIITKYTPNSFFETNLDAIIKMNDIKSLIVCGMMSHMCIDTTVREAKNYGLDITLLEDACTTRDLIFNGVTIPAKTVHLTFMAALNGAFAKVIKTSELKI